MEELYLRDTNKRRYFLYNNKRDRKQIILFSIYALTLVGPTIESFRGYRRIADSAWFLHPVICFMMFWVYFNSVISWQFSHSLELINKKVNHKI